ncbi:MAG: hypothetical protein IPN42_02545 [Methylococcaceae bacterium]|nr:hypothetical protein [Methylococcaceae bacterium]
MWAGFIRQGPVLSLGGVQTKLSVGQANDPYEREADRVADHVTSGGVIRRMAVTPITSGSLTQRSPTDQQQQEDDSVQRQPEPEETVQAQSIPRQQQESLPVQRENEDDSAQPLQRMEENDNEAVQAKCECDENEKKQGVIPVQRQDNEGTDTQGGNQEGQTEQVAEGGAINQADHGQQAGQEERESGAGEQNGRQEQKGAETNIDNRESAGQEKEGGEQSGDGGHQEPEQEAGSVVQTMPSVEQTHDDPVLQKIGNSTAHGSTSG